MQKNPFDRCLDGNAYGGQPSFVRRYGRNWIVCGGDLADTWRRIFLLSFCTGEKVGYGDGWTLMMIGLFLGAYRCFLILFAGLLAESAVAAVLFALKKIGRDKEIPFLPFLLLGVGVVVCL